MISNKHFNKLIAILMAIAISFSLIIIVLPKSSSTATYIEQPDYVTTIFDDDKVMDINIEMDETAWQEMLDNASAEEYTAANITVNGVTYNNIAIRPKGNSSLSQLVMDDTTERYSFKVKFDEYVDGQTLDGLSKLVLNNNMSDATYMREYLSYKLLDSLGVPTPACSYANITVNGEEWGLYLAVEPVEEEFIERNYGSTDGNLYKPESDSVAVGGNKDKYSTNTKPDFDPTQITQDSNNTTPGNSNNQMMTPPDMNSGGNSNQQMQMPSDTSNGNGQMMTPPDINSGGNSNQQMQMPSDIGGGMMVRGMGGNSNGSDLVWNGNDISNYSAIFDNAIFKTTDSDDYTKILDMIEHLDTMEDIESYLNVDEVLRYFAANTFLVNLDSYASNMNNNYYLYEDDGVVSILPWDYNLSFGGFQAGSASSAINFPIDSPVSGTLEDNPLIANLLEVDEYKELYHQYLNEIVNNFVNNGTYEMLVTKTDTLISDYVKNDATAFYTFDEYTEAVSNLLNFGLDRSTSISAQLDGSQPSTSTGTIETTVNLTAMGQQGGGNNKGGMVGMNMAFNKDTAENSTNNTMTSPDNNIHENNNTSSIDKDLMMQAMQIIQTSEDGSITDSIKEQLLALGLNNDDITKLESIQTSMPGGNSNTNKEVINNNFAMVPGNSNSSNFSTLLLTGLSILLLIISLIFVKFSSKRKYTS
ncbi:MULTISPECIES: CotH kinase family protein [unclassified Clostridium]|uniref:CotH kinase family protein n=1 Tax=Clostridium TaxID=1485 RepID=UPI001C8CDF44|nr:MULTISPECIES: CotH kinase family protein [unclassified Clostridium]MBX9136492.1 spore coat protein CotH [Clostridium sp. K12(2020)]MBX9143027.1 spore coat protein CotH [Clostridium sp. K13]MDU2289716.1 CotH kinase family protein [Clostridium celatum]